MTDDFAIVQTEEHGVRIDCFDYETADQFDDYLTEELDLDIPMGCVGEVQMFWLGDGYTLESAAKLVADFKLYDEKKWGQKGSGPAVAD